MKLHIHLQNNNLFPNLISKNQLQVWLNATITYLSKTVNLNKKKFLTIRFVDKNESTLLNETYRHKKGPTNVLSFVEEDIPGFKSDAFGDLIICIPLVLEEAQAQDKTFTAHLAHLVIHGFLHLLGYDHMNDKEAEIMEGLEAKILVQLGFADPYHNTL